MRSGVTYPKHRVDVWWDERTRRRMPPIPLQRRRRLGLREFQDCHSNHCGEADKRTNGNYGQTAILSGEDVHTFVHTRAYAYRTVITLQITTVRSHVGDIRRRGRKDRDLEGRSREKRLGVYERCRRDRRRRERAEEGEGGRRRMERNVRGQREAELREKERERPLENYKLHVVPNRPSKIIPAHPAAIMNM